MLLKANKNQHDFTSVDDYVQLSMGYLFPSDTLALSLEGDAFSVDGLCSFLQNLTSSIAMAYDWDDLVYCVDLGTVRSLLDSPGLDFFLQLRCSIQSRTFNVVLSVFDCENTEIPDYENCKAVVAFNYIRA